VRAAGACGTAGIIALRIATGKKGAEKKDRVLPVFFFYENHELNVMKFITLMLIFS